jgi:pyrimidine-nucleoside phosphorylase
MSKKIAEGAKYLVIDLKIGSGAFMPNLRRAKELAGHLIATGESFGQKVKVVFSNMNSPLGHAVGTALESIEAIEYLKGNYLKDTYEITTALVAQMLIMAGKARDFASAEAMIRRVVEDGSALAKFAEIISAQKGNPHVIEDYSSLITPDTSFQSRQKAVALCKRLIPGNWICIGEGKTGRMQTSDILDYSAGAMLYPKIGDQIKAGDQIGILHCNDQAQGETVVNLIRDAYQIAESPKEHEKLIYEII